MEREELIKLAEQLIKNGCSDELKEALIKEYPELNHILDKNELNDLLLMLHGLNIDEDYVESIKNWLTKLITLHTESGWIPSEVQLKALNTARINAETDEFVILDSLYADLLKLKG